VPQSVASHGCINALAMGHGHLCYNLSSRLPPTIVFAGAHTGMLLIIWSYLKSLDSVHTTHILLNLGVKDF